jgi:predicted phage terminase large subunit-like protein
VLSGGAAPDVGWDDSDELRLAELLQAQYGAEGLDAFIRRVSPRHPPPKHIEPVMELWERTRHERVLATIELPPRHAKTTTGLHGLAWRLSLDPAATNGFATFGDDYAASRSRIGRTLARAAGVELSKDMANLHEWRTVYGGGLLAHGYQGEWTGQGITGVGLIDDPYKDRIAAESVKIRENVWEWFQDVFWTRLEEQASVIVQHTRWHEDDMIGRLKAGKFPGYKWEHLRLPAIAEDPDDALGRAPGEALWQERVPIDELLRIRASVHPYGWAALYQQRPRPRGDVLFENPGRFKLADWRPNGHRIIICCDPAATQSTTADYSAAFVLAAQGYGPDMTVWVIDGWRGQIKIPALVRKLRQWQLRYWGAPVAVEAVAGFKSVPDMLQELDHTLKVRPVTPVGDKWLRAQAVANAYNQGRFLIPVDVAWAKPLIAECGKFTGVGDAEDDQVDAISHGFNELWAPKVPGKRRTDRSRRAFG